MKNDKGKKKEEQFFPELQIKLNHLCDGFDSFSLQKAGAQSDWV